MSKTTQQATIEELQQQIEKQNASIEKLEEQIDALRDEEAAQAQIAQTEDEVDAMEEIAATLQALDKKYANCSGAGVRRVLDYVVQRVGQSDYQAPAMRYAQKQEAPRINVDWLNGAYARAARMTPGSTWSSSFGA